MSTFVERNFRVKGVVDCFLTLSDGTQMHTIEGIEVQLWHEDQPQTIFLGKGITNEDGEFVIDVLVDSPVSYIEDGKINNVVTRMYYNGELLSEPDHLYDPDAVLYFAQLTPQPSSEYKEAINTLVKQLKEDGNWNKLDRFWIFAAEYQQNATISLANPGSTPLSENGSPTWTANQGYTGNGTSTYLNTNFVPSTDGLYSRDNGSLGYYSRTDVSNNGCDMGCNNGTVLISIFARVSNNFYNRINCSTSTIVSWSDSRGLFAGSRNTSTTQLGYVNGVQRSSGSQTTNGEVAYSVYVMAQNGSGTAASFSTRQFAMAFIGTGDIDQLKLYNAFQAFATTRGFNV